MVKFLFSLCINSWFVFISITLRVRLLPSESEFYNLVAVWLLTSHFASLCLSFLKHKMLGPVSKIVIRITGVNTSRRLGTG